jgi:DNA-binding NtrC family response regulator
MTTIVQVEYRASLLEIREEILQFLGHPIVSVDSSAAARRLDLSNCEVGAILIGHRAPWQERCNLISHFKKILPSVPIVASLRQRDEPFGSADYNCPADDPPLWVKTVTQALAGIV